MSERKDNTNAILEAWDICLQYRWRFIIPAFVLTAAVLAIGFFLPRRYKAEGQFERRTDMVMREITTKGATRTFQDPRNMLIEELKGKPAIEKLIIDLAPEIDRFENQGIHINIAELKKNIRNRTLVHWDISSSTLDRIRVQYIDTNAELSQLVVNQLIENYIERTRKQNNGRLEQSAEFFKNEVVANRSRIEKFENNVLEFEIKFSDLLPENPNNIQTKIATLQETLNDLISEREAAASRVITLQNTIEKEPATVPSLVMGRNPALKRLDEKKQELTQRYTQYTSVLKMKRRHPDVAALEAEITELDQQIAATPQEIVIERQTKTNPKLQELELRLTTAQSDHDALKRHTASMEAKLATMQKEANKIYEVRSSYKKLQRQVQETQRQITFWEDNLRRVDMALAAESGNKGIRLSFIRPATIARQPISPNCMQLILIAIAMGTFCGALNVFVTHRTNETFNDGEQAAKYCDLQLMGSVSEIISVQQRKIRRIRNRILYPANAVIMGSILLMISALLYLDLEKPETLDLVKEKVAAFITPDSATAAESSPFKVNSTPIVHDESDNTLEGAAE